MNRQEISREYLIMGISHYVDGVRLIPIKKIYTKSNEIHYLVNIMSVNPDTTEVNCFTEDAMEKAMIDCKEWQIAKSIEKNAPNTKTN